MVPVGAVSWVKCQRTYSIFYTSESETWGLEFSNFKAVVGWYCCFLEDTSDVLIFFIGAKESSLLG